MIQSYPAVRLVTMTRSGGGSLAPAWAKRSRWVVAADLEEIGVRAIRREQEQHGVHLLAAAATLRRAMGAPGRPAARPSLEGTPATLGAVLEPAPSAEEDRQGAAIRAALGAAGFAAAWAEGRALSLEAAVRPAPADTDAAPQGQ